MARRTYAVEFTPAALRAVKNLPKDMQPLIIKAAEALARDPRPHGVEKLSGDDHVYRVRVGDYRLLYEIHDRQLVVIVITAGHRREIYRKARRR